MTRLNLLLQIGFATPIGCGSAAAGDPAPVDGGIDVCVSPMRCGASSPDGADSASESSDSQFDAPPAEDAGASDAIEGGNCWSLATYCSMPILDPPCAMDWSSAAEREWCRDFPNVSVLRGCHGYNIVFAAYFDLGLVYFYDAVSGALVGVAQAAGELACIAGELPTIDVADCQNGAPQNICVPSEAGKAGAGD